MKIIIVLVIVAILAGAVSAKNIGPCVGYEHLGAEVYRMWIDEDKDGKVDYYEVYAWNGEKLVFIRREEIEED